MSSVSANMYETKSVKELRALAKAKGVKLGGAVRKSAIVSKLRGPCGTVLVPFNKSAAAKVVCEMKKKHVMGRHPDVRAIMALTESGKVAGKRGRGRPAGSKSKVAKKVNYLHLVGKSDYVRSLLTPKKASAKKGGKRGRPAGSKNKVKLD